MRPLISFLIPTLRERTTKFNSLCDKLFLQIEEHNLQKKVEVLSICDNRDLQLSVKRNTLQKMSSGLYFLHMDDDDRVADDYCKTVCDEIMKLKDKVQTLEELPDIIGYNQLCEVDDKVFIVKTNPASSMGLTPCGNQYDESMNHNGNIPVYQRVPWQYHLWSRDKFARVYRSDADTNAKEDQNWLKRAYLEYPQSYHNIDKILHYYYFKNDGTSTCQ